MTDLYCSYNNLEDLHVGNNTGLTNLGCDNNGIESLYLRNNKELNWLHCNNNELFRLNLSDNLKLTELICSHNRLQNLHVKNGNNINFTNFIATDNPDLYCIEVDIAAWSTANWNFIDPQSYFSEECGDLPLYMSIHADVSGGAVPLTVNFSSLAEGGIEPYTYVWDFGDGTTSTDSNPSHTFESTGNYMVTATVTDHDASTVSDTLYIDVVEMIYSLSGKAYNEEGTTIISSGYAELYSDGDPEPLTETVLTGEGQFLFSDLDPGSYIIKVTPDTISFAEYLPTYSGGVLALYEAEPVSLESDTDGADIYCRMKPEEGSGEGEISGKVLSTEGAGGLKLAYDHLDEGTPIPGTMVYLTVHESDVLAGADRTGSDGGYRFGGLEDGQYNFMVDYMGIPMSEPDFPIEVGTAGRTILVDALVSVSGITIVQITGVEERAGTEGMFRIYPNPAGDLIMIEPADGSAIMGTMRVELYSVTGQKLIDNGYSGMTETGIELDVRVLPAGSYHLRIACDNRIYNAVVMVGW